MNRHILLQLFAATKTDTASQSSSSTQQSENYGSSSHSETHTQGESITDTQSHSNTDTTGQSKTETYGKSWASGTIDDKTQEQFDKYNNDYVESDKVTEAYNALQETLSQKPTFESTYADKLSSLYDQIMNREAFNYNFNEDEMYQLYKDQYTAAGKTAMQDTLGQAQAANGGYGSSYSQSAAQQTYQNYLQDLNNIIPTLRDEAYEEYEQEGQDLLNKYDITNNAYNNEYNQYRDSVSDWQADRSFNYGLYSDERNFDYSQYTDNRNYWQNEYWNEKNAEQSNYSNSLTDYWENSQTDATSHSDTKYWEDSTTDTTTSGWSNSSSNTNSSSYGSTLSQSLGSSGSSSGSSSSYNKLKLSQDAEAAANSSWYNWSATPTRANTNSERTAIGTTGTDENSSNYFNDNTEGQKLYDELSYSSPIRNNSQVTGSSANKLLSEIIDKISSNSDPEAAFEALEDSKTWTYSSNKKKYALDDADLDYIAYLLNL